MADIPWPRPQAVSLSGKTRLTYRQAVALFTAAAETWENELATEQEYPLSDAEFRALHEALDKLALAIRAASGELRLREAARNPRLAKTLPEGHGHFGCRCGDGVLTRHCRVKNRSLRST